WFDAGRNTWFEDESHVSTNTGNVAGSMLTLLQLFETNERQYLDGAARLGDWVIENTEDSRGDAGFTAGYEGWESGAVSGAGSRVCPSSTFVNGQCKRMYKSTEHNIDIYSAFSRLNIAYPNTIQPLQVRILDDGGAALAVSSK